MMALNYPWPPIGGPPVPPTGAPAGRAGVTQPIFTSDRGAGLWAAGTVNIPNAYGSTTFQLLDSATNRRDVTLINQSATPLGVLVAPTQGAGPGGSVSLAVGAGFTFNTAGEIWVECAGATPSAPASVSFVVEFG